MKESAKINYILQWADDSAILGQRLGEWCGHGPALELDMALTNISLDLFGQARSLYAYAAEIEGAGRTEDDLCFLRNEEAFKNALLLELPNGDFAQTILKQYFFDEYQVLFLSELEKSADEQLAAIASKSLKEALYHRRLSCEWVKRLGDGTQESHDRIQSALDLLWSYTDSLFIETEGDLSLRDQNISVPMTPIKTHWLKNVQSTLSEATLSLPENNWQHSGGRGRVHTEHLGYILAEMQMLQRTYPGQEW